VRRSRADWKYADIIAVHGDVVRCMVLLQRVDHVMKTSRLLGIGDVQVEKSEKRPSNSSTTLQVYCHLQRKSAPADLGTPCAQSDTTMESGY
jgi:hypothetical protein